MSQVCRASQKGNQLERKSSAYLDKTSTESQKNNKDKGFKNEKKEK